jgi:hypothetical protein
VKLVALVVLVGLAGCATSRPRSDDRLITEEDDPAARAAHIGRRHPGEDAPPSAAVAPAPAPPRGPLARAGSIARAELDAVLDAGPGAFLRGIQVDAEVVDRRLRGWRIRRFWPGDGRFARVDLLPGDLVLTVNGHLIVRPEHLQSVWDGLRDAHRLTVEVERAGAIYQLDYTIVDSPVPSGSNSGP